MTDCVVNLLHITCHFLNYLMSGGIFNFIALQGCFTLKPFVPKGQENFLMQYIHYLKTRLKSHCLLPLIPWSPNPVQSRSFPNFVSTKLIKPMNGRNTVILQFLLIMINNVLASHTQVLQQIFQSLVHLFVIIQ